MTSSVRGQRKARKNKRSTYNRRVARARELVLAGTIPEWFTPAELSKADPVLFPPKPVGDYLLDMQTRGDAKVTYGTGARPGRRYSFEFTPYERLPHRIRTLLETPDQVVDMLGQLHGLVGSTDDIDLDAVGMTVSECTDAAEAENGGQKLIIARLVKDNWLVASTGSNYRLTKKACNRLGVEPAAREAETSTKSGAAAGEDAGVDPAAEEPPADTEAADGTEEPPEDAESVAAAGEDAPDVSEDPEEEPEADGLAQDDVPIQEDAPVAQDRGHEPEAGTGAEDTPDPDARPIDMDEVAALAAAPAPPPEEAPDHGEVAVLEGQDDLRNAWEATIALPSWIKAALRLLLHTVAYEDFPVNAEGRAPELRLSNAKSVRTIIRNGYRTGVLVRVRPGWYQFNREVVPTRWKVGLKVHDARHDQEVQAALAESDAEVRLITDRLNNALWYIACYAYDGSIAHLSATSREKALWHVDGTRSTRGTLARIANELAHELSGMPDDDLATVIEHLWALHQQDEEDAERGSDEE